MADSSQSSSDPAGVEDAIRDELAKLGVTTGIDVMARRIRRRLEAEGVLR
jgi:hypothetical protein